MNRALLAIVLAVAAASFAGCADEGTGQTMNHPFKKKSASTAAPTDPSQANYFEYKKDGRTYVFSKIDSMNAFREGKTPAKTSTQDLDGKPVVFENRGFTDYNRLVAEYKKAHNVP
jgi:hypothetical protein